jgi:mRNA interferase MazF
MIIKRGEIWIANLNPKQGKEVGKTRPVLVIQSDFLNEVGHTTTIIVPISSKEQESHLRFPIKTENLKKESFILIDQIQSIDVKTRLNKKIGFLDSDTMKIINQRIKNVLDLE